MPNIDVKPLKLSSWRKIALGTWHNAGDPSVYGILDLNATNLVSRQENYRARGVKPPTVTTIVARATALTLKKFPQINGLIRWGRIYNRDTVSVFLQTAVDEAGQELSGVVIENAEAKSLSQIGEELAAKARAIREDRDPNFKKAKSSFRLVPAFMMRPVLNLVGFLLYTLNLDLRWAGLPKDPFGSVMITSVGSLGVDAGFGPLVPYSRVPLLLAVGVINDSPIVVNKQVAVAPVFKIFATFDHRFMDGVLAAKMAKHMRYLLETNEGLDEVGLK